MKTIKIDQLLELKNPIIIDIRHNIDYKNNHIPAAINIPYYKLKRNYKHYLNHIDIYYLYCDYGEKSQKLCNYLNNKNYNTISIKNGFDSYEKKSI